MPFLREAQFFLQLVPHMPTRPEVAFHLKVTRTGGSGSPKAMATSSRKALEENLTRIRCVHMPTRPEVAFHLNVSCTGGIDLKARPLLRIRYGSEDDGNILAKGAGGNLTHTRSVHMPTRPEVAFHLR